MSKAKYANLIAACSVAGNAAGKVATEINVVCKNKRRAQCDDIKSEAYGELLAGRKAADLPVADKRAYEAMRQGFSRFYKSKGWGKVGKPSGKSSGKGAKPADVSHAGMMHWIDEGIAAVEECEAADFAVDKAVKLLKDFRAQFNVLKPAKE